MTTISPTRVSMYDFLYQDTQPMVSLLADAAQLSLPQTHLALNDCLQAIVSALLAYHQRHQAHAVNKKLFHNAAIKELRKYNAMNFMTVRVSLYHRNDMVDILFGDITHVTTVCKHVATKVKTTTARIKTLLTSLCVIALRELAILVEYSQLDENEIDHWFILQPQFLSENRFLVAQSVTVIHANPSKKALGKDKVTLKNSLIAADMMTHMPPTFDPYWYEVTAFTPEKNFLIADIQQATAHYLTAIGRSSSNIRQGYHNDMLVFIPMPAITVPHQSWLLQLAKIADIHLSRHRLRIASEPKLPPAKPLIDFHLLLGNNEAATMSSTEKPIEYDATLPLWKNSVILIIIIVISTLGALATLKYKTKEAEKYAAAAALMAQQKALDERQLQDVAIIKIKDKETVEASEK